MSPLLHMHSWNFLIAFFTPFITGSIGYAYGFVFAGCNLANAIIVFFFLYESSGITLEAVDQLYNDPDVKPWQSGSWVPPGYSSRQDVTAQADAMTRRKPYEKQQHLENMQVGNGDKKPHANGNVERRVSDDATLA